MFYQLFSPNTETEATHGRGETLGNAGESRSKRRSRIGLYSSAVIYTSLTLKLKGTNIMPYITTMNTTAPATCNTHHASGGSFTRHAIIGDGCFTHLPKGGGWQ